MWFAHSAKSGENMLSRRKKVDRRTVSLGALSTSAPSVKATVPLAASHRGVDCEDFGRKVPKHVFNQERMFSTLGQGKTLEKRPPTPILRATSTMISSPSTFSSISPATLVRSHLFSFLFSFSFSFRFLFLFFSHPFLLNK